MTCAEIQAVYAGGPEAVTTLVQSLWARSKAQQEQIQAQQPKIEAQQVQIEALTQRVGELEDRLGIKSRINSKLR